MGVERKKRKGGWDDAEAGRCARGKMRAEM